MTTTSATDVRALESQHVLQIYRRFPIVLERGEGVRVFDEHGRDYIEAVSSFYCVALG